MGTISKILLASKNVKKTEELRRILTGYGVEVLDMNDVDFPDVEETGATFAENARLKAEAGAEHTGLAVLADDSGLCVDALNGGPGVYTKRYGDYKKLLSEMKSIPFGKRTAHFNCTLAFKKPGQETQLFEGTVEGFILPEARGEGGFGYDPVFLPEGEQRSFAEMPAHQKGEISHRGRALRKFINFLKK